MTTTFGAIDLYDVLGLAPDADTDEIVKAYKRLSKLTHPDRAGGDKDRFQSVQEAHEVLHVPERRVLYEEARKIWLFNQLTFDERLQATRQERLKSEAAAEAQAVIVRDELRARQQSSAQVQILAASKERWSEQIAEQNAAKQREEEAAELLRAKRQRRREKKAAAAAAAAAAAEEGIGSGADKLGGAPATAASSVAETFVTSATNVTQHATVALATDEQDS